jgi:hypothetical protein
LGKAEAELLTGNATGAASDAKVALDMAVSHQGGLPYSNRSGLAWLMLGRALRETGEPVRAGAAFKAAAEHLANIVDADHPALVQARGLSATAL